MKQIFNQNNDTVPQLPDGKCYVLYYHEVNTVYKCDVYWEECSVTKTCKSCRDKTAKNWKELKLLGYTTDDITKSDLKLYRNANVYHMDIIEQTKDGGR